MKEGWKTKRCFGFFLIHRIFLFSPGNKVAGCFVAGFFFGQPVVASLVAKQVLTFVFLEGAASPPAKAGEKLRKYSFNLVLSHNTMTN